MVKVTIDLKHKTMKRLSDIYGDEPIRDVIHNPIRCDIQNHDSKMRKYGIPRKQVGDEHERD